MSFLRVKKIKGNDYAYLVKNNWTSKGPRQEVKRYLGRVHRFKGKGSYDVNFVASKKGFLIELVKFELSKVSGKLKKEKIEFDDKKLNFFKGTGKSKIRENQRFSVSLRNSKNSKEISGTTQGGNRGCVLGLNQGFMCDYTLRRILNFKKKGDIEVDSVKLAKFFIEAGFEVPQEYFIEYFERL
ncbi:MAG: hypothetical protein KAT77_05945 [Nanoarchaeota archaeon]|nr:hypothetical protein [Nanoarchaeota archaeon]